MALSSAALTRRKKHITATEVPALYGESPWMNSADVFWSKVNDTPASKGNGATMLGDVFEPLILDHAADELNLNLTRNQFRVSKSKDDGLLSATLDAIDKKKNVAVEAKLCLDRSKWQNENGDYMTPMNYWLQCQTQLICSNVDVVYLVKCELKPWGPDYHIEPILADPEAVENIIETATRFWRDYVLTETPPPDSVPSMEILRAKRRIAGKEISEFENPTTAMLAAQRFRELKAAEKEIKTELDECQCILVDLLGDAESAKLPDGSAVSFKSYERANFCKSEFRASHPSLYETFVSKDEYRRFNLSKPKIQKTT